MGAARRDHTATLLSDGKVLVSGGQNSAALASAEVYTPSSGTWRAAGTLAAPRYSHAAARLPNGSVLVSGGYNSTNGYLAAAELYNPASNTWSATGPMLSPRYIHTATPLPDGKVLVTGGYNSASGYLATAEVYSPASGTWSATGAMSTLRGYHTATLLNNGKVLVAGGRGNSSLPRDGGAVRSGHGHLECHGLHVLAAREPHGDAAARRQGARLGRQPTGPPTWRRRSCRSGHGNLEHDGLPEPARSSPAAVVMSNGKVLIAGGIRSTTYLATRRRTTPARAAWTSAGSMARLAGITRW